MPPSSEQAATPVRIVHVVRSDAFAGVERYVCGVANGLAGRGHDVRVIGGAPARMRTELEPGVAHTPAATTREAFSALARGWPVDLVHAHMTAAEAAAVLSSPCHRAPIISTRHFPDPRGSAGLNRLAGRLVARRLAGQIAISRYVADGIGEPAIVLYNGVAESPAASLEAPCVVMMQRLEAEKAPGVAIRAWAASGLASRGWRLEIAGSGSLEREVRGVCQELGVAESVTFLGQVEDTDAVLAAASILIAPAPGEPFGLAVVEAMAHGVPVVAAAAAGHLETLSTDGLLFASGDAEEAGSQLVRLADDPGLRRDAGRRLRERQRRLFSIESHVARLEQLYSAVFSRS